MAFGKKKIREALKILKEVRASSTMVRAGFEKGDYIDTDTDREFTEMIKDKTRLYRQSWLIKPLDEVIESLEKEA